LQSLLAVSGARRCPKRGGTAALPWPAGLKDPSQPIIGFRSETCQGSLRPGFATHSPF
jgi:hypothetical protein